MASVLAQRRTKALLHSTKKLPLPAPFTLSGVDINACCRTLAVAIALAVILPTCVFNQLDVFRQCSDAICAGATPRTAHACPGTRTCGDPDSCVGDVNFVYTHSAAGVPHWAVTEPHPQFESTNKWLPSSSSELASMNYVARLVDTKIGTPFGAPNCSVSCWTDGVIPTDSDCCWTADTVTASPTVVEAFSKEVT